jgi:hypothetical protein
VSINYQKTFTNGGYNSQQVQIPLAKQKTTPNSIYQGGSNQANSTSQTRIKEKGQSSKSRSKAREESVNASIS